MTRNLWFGCVFACTCTLACAVRKSAAPARAVQEAPAAPPAASAAGGEEPTAAEADKAGSTAPAAKAPAPVPGGGMVVMPNEVANAQAQFDQASKAFAASATDCLSLCKSLGSMTNATEHLCGLVEGTADQQRCTDARARLAAAQAKVKSTCSGTCG